MEETLLHELRRIQQLSVNELQAEWSRLYNGEQCHSRNRTYLVKRLCWRAQEIRLGGLSDRARARLKELEPDAFTRARTPSFTPMVADTALAAKTPRPVRDLRLPPPGSVLVKNYRGRELRLAIHDDHFELDGQSFQSLSEAARFVSGSRWDGFLFWNLKRRKRKA